MNEKLLKDVFGVMLKVEAELNRRGWKLKAPAKIKIAQTIMRHIVADKRNQKRLDATADA